jgi:hypothetical protein
MDKGKETNTLTPIKIGKGGHLTSTTGTHRVESEQEFRKRMERMRKEYKTKK